MNDKVIPWQIHYCYLPPTSPYHLDEKADMDLVLYRRNLLVFILKYRAF